MAKILIIVLGILLGFLLSALLFKRVAPRQEVLGSCQEQGGFFVGHFFSEDICYLEAYPK